MSDWYPGPSNLDVDPPVYTTIPTIHVADGGGVASERAHLWEDAAATGVELWEPSGLSFVVTQADLNPGYPWLGPDGTGDLIGIMAQKLPDGVNGVGDYIPATEQVPGGGYAIISRRRFGSLWELHATELNHRYAHRKARQLICHEVGHALGFAHGGTGVMAGAWRPNAEEIAAVKEYYLG
jgi:hypothetical protein